MEKSCPVGSEFEGTVSSVSDFGIFVVVPNIEIQGMIHYKDLSWSENPEILSKYKKNQKVKCKVVEIDLEKEKLRCSVRALLKDPFDFFKGKKEKDIITVFVKDTTENSINVSTLKNDNENSFNDELLNKAIEIIIVSKQASISLLQRRLSIGYSRAARLIDEMERLKIVGPFSGSKAREILVDESYLETIRNDEEI